MSTLGSILSTYSEATCTAVLALALVGAASGAAWLRSRNQSRETQRFWQLTFRHIAAAGFMLGVAIIWRKELHSLFIALGAATAGILLTFRENWLSLLAFWMRVIKRQYNLNDFIEVDGVRGKVIDITWLTTVVAESVPGKDGTIYSGKVVHIPNSHMLLSPVRVDNLTDEFTLSVLTLPLPLGASPLAAEKVLLEAARVHCAPFFDEACKHMNLFEKEKALGIVSVEPRAFLSIGDEGAVTIRLRITVPVEEGGRIHQAILHDFFTNADAAAWPLVAAS